MSTDESDLPTKPRIKPWNEVLAELIAENPQEFTSERTLSQELKNMDEIIAVEEDYLDNPDRATSYLCTEPMEENELQYEDMTDRFYEEKRNGLRQAELDYEG